MDWMGKHNAAQSLCVTIHNMYRHRSKVSWKELKAVMVFFNSRRCLAVFGWAKLYPGVLLLTIQRYLMCATACLEEHPVMAHSSFSSASAYGPVPASLLPSLGHYSPGEWPAEDMHGLQPQLGQLATSFAFWGNVCVTDRDDSSMGEHCWGFLIQQQENWACQQKDSLVLPIAACLLLTDLSLWPSAHRRQNLHFLLFPVSLFSFNPYMTSLISVVEFLAADLYSLLLMFLVFHGQEELFITLWFGFPLASKPEQLLASTAFFLFRGIVVPLRRQ